MLSIGEFSNICKVSTKTLRYYAEIGLILPDEINPENGYRYYSIEQLEKMLFINRLKSYNFSLEEIKTILDSEELQDEKLYLELTRKKKVIEKQVQEFEKTLDQLNNDISNLRQGKSIMSYLESIDVHSRWEKINLPYGYLWWIIDGKEHAYAAMGDGGNVIYFNTKKKIVVSIASFFVPKVKDRIEFIKEYIEPIFENCD
nr:helix-turn-helix domain-containing protein [uncultured Anaerocolumna sp.]